MPDGIKPKSDGLELELASGETVRLDAETSDGQPLFANRVWVDDETAVYGADADDFHAKIAFEVVD